MLLEVLLWIGLAPLAYISETLLHEGSHAIVALRHGMEIVSFKFWPHWHDHDNDPSTRELMYWGRVSWRPKTIQNGMPVGIDRASICLAPYVVGLVVWVALLSALCFGAPRWLAVFGAAVTIDMTRGLLQPFWRVSKGDVNRAAVVMGWDRSRVKLAGAIIVDVLMMGVVFLVLVWNW